MAYGYIDRVYFSFCSKGDSDNLSIIEEFCIGTSFHTYRFMLAAEARFGAADGWRIE